MIEFYSLLLLRVDGPLTLPARAVGVTWCVSLPQIAFLCSNQRRDISIRSQSVLLIFQLPFQKFKENQMGMFDTSRIHKDETDKINDQKLTRGETGSVYISLLRRAIPCIAIAAMMRNYLKLSSRVEV